MGTLKTVRQKYNRHLDIEGVLFTMYSGRLNLTMQVVAQVKKVLLATRSTGLSFPAPCG